MSIKKRYFKNKPVCRVRFKLEKAAAGKAVVVGEFNGWKTDAAPMRKLKDGSFTKSIDLEPGRDYQFRYLLDDRVWENDSDADRYVSTPFHDAENSVVRV